MTKDPVFVSPETRIGDMARVMIDAHIHRTIVIDPVSLAPCGIVSSMDILAVLARMNQASPAAYEYERLEVPGSVLP
jgi:CBS domain-containing protein